jgi:hypothetical protein
VVPHLLVNVSPELSMSVSNTSRSCCGFCKWIISIYLLSLSAPALLLAQDAVRPSLAGEAASEARHEDVERIPYNLLVGPVRFRLGASVGVEYNDNINYAEGRFAEDDVIIRPQINFDAIWPLSQINTLRFDIGMGYSFYLDHSSADTNGLLIAPGSQIAFDFFIGDFRINVHDRFTVQQDPVAEFQVSNTSDFGRLENYAGLSVLWDLNQLLLSVGYDHYNYVSTTSQFDYLDRQAEQLYGSAAFNVTDTVSIGAEGSAVFTYYDTQDVLSDSNVYSTGGFVEIKLTNNLRARVAGGYQWMDFDRDFVVFNLPVFGLIVAPDEMHIGDYYLNGSITHTVNAVFNHSISAGHEHQLGINSNAVRLNYVRYTANWNLIRNTLLSGEFFYENGDDSGGFAGFDSNTGLPSGEHMERFGGAVTIGYQLTPHVTLGLRYQYTQKDSNLLLRDYTQNRVSLDGTYSF